MNQITPGGILSVKHKWPNSKKFDNQDTFLTINQEPVEVSYYFWAQQFWFINGDGGYLGVQTGGQINGLNTKIAIFSVWQALDAKKANSTNSWAGAFGHEGTGFSCKIPFDWRQNIKYRLRLMKNASDTPPISNSWSAFIQEVSTGIEECIGQILLPSQWGGLTRDSNFFVEYFLPVNGCENVPFAQATLHRPNREYGNIIPIEVPTYETYGTCASNGRVTYRQDDSVLLETGL